MLAVNSVTACVIIAKRLQLLLQVVVVCLMDTKARSRSMPRVSIACNARSDDIPFQRPAKPGVSGCLVFHAAKITIPNLKK
jgi:hypothetical protein